MTYCLAGHWRADHSDSECTNTTIVLIIHDRNSDSGWSKGIDGSTCVTQCCCWITITIIHPSGNKFTVAEVEKKFAVITVTVNGRVLPSTFDTGGDLSRNVIGPIVAGYNGVEHPFSNTTVFPFSNVYLTGHYMCSHVHSRPSFHLLIMYNKWYDHKIIVEKRGCEFGTKDGTLTYKKNCGMMVQPSLDYYHQCNPCKCPYCSKVPRGIWLLFQMYLLRDYQIVYPWSLHQELMPMDHASALQRSNCYQKESGIVWLQLHGHLHMEG